MPYFLLYQNVCMGWFVIRKVMDAEKLQFLRKNVFLYGSRLQPRKGVGRIFFKFYLTRNFITFNLVQVWSQQSFQNIVENELY